MSKLTTAQVTARTTAREVYRAAVRAAISHEMIGQGKVQSWADALKAGIKAGLTENELSKLGAEESLMTAHKLSSAQAGKLLVRGAKRKPEHDKTLAAFRKLSQRARELAGIKSSHGAAGNSNATAGKAGKAGKGKGTPKGKAAKAATPEVRTVVKPPVLKNVVPPAMRDQAAWRGWGADLVGLISHADKKNAKAPQVVRSIVDRLLAVAKELATVTID